MSNYKNNVHEGAGQKKRKGRHSVQFADQVTSFGEDYTQQKDKMSELTNKGMSNSLVRWKQNSYSH